MWEKNVFEFVFNKYFIFFFVMVKRARETGMSLNTNDDEM